MKIMQIFKSENKFISDLFSDELARFEESVNKFDKSRWTSLDYSTSSLSKILGLENSFKLPMLIEAMCNFYPSILTPKYYFVENGEFEEISELEVSEASNKAYMINPFTGVEDFDFKPKVIRRFVLSKGVLDSE